MPGGPTGSNTMHAVLPELNWNLSEGYLTGQRDLAATVLFLPKRRCEFLPSIRWLKSGRMRRPIFDRHVSNRGENRSWVNNRGHKRSFRRRLQLALMPNSFFSFKRLACCLPFLCFRAEKRLIGYYLDNGVPGGILAASSGLRRPLRSTSAASLFVRSSLSLTGSVPIGELGPPDKGRG